MALITPDSGICLGESGTTFYPACSNPIIRENAEKFVTTEGNRNLLLDGDCDIPPIVSFSCNTDRVVVDSGKFITISNTCTMPIKITGFRNPNPQRFSLFEYPNHVGTSVYESGNTSQLPIEIDPYETYDIKTFFHPLRSELETGTPGTFNVRNGDKFGAKVTIHPGFPVINCSADAFDCDAYFTLTGEFICDNIDIPEFLDDQSQYIAPDFKTLNTIDNAYCIPKIPSTIWSTDHSSTTYNSNTPENTFSGLSGASLSSSVQLGNFLRTTDQSFIEDSLWATGALGGFYSIITGLINNGLDYTVSSLLSRTLSNHEVIYLDGQNTERKMSVSYDPFNYITVTDNISRTMTGMLFHITGSVDQNSINARNGVVFFDRLSPGGNAQTRIFLSESGDFSADQICDWTSS